MSSSDPTPRPQAFSSSSSTNIPPSATAPEKSYFEAQRAALIGEIAISMEHVLANINKLNRSLEGVIAVGNEFGSVEALWSQFENVMAKDQDVVEEQEEEQEGRRDEQEGHGDAAEEDVDGR